MKHPFSQILVNKKGTVLFALVKNTVEAFDLQSGLLLDQFIDELGPDFTIKQKFEKIIAERKAAAEHEKQSINEKEIKDKVIKEELNAVAPSPGPETVSETGSSVEPIELKNPNKEESAAPQKKKQKLNKPKKAPKIPKIPTPGPGAPQLYNDVRNLYLSPSEKYLVVTTNSDKAAIVFELKYEALRNKDVRLLNLVKRQPFPKRPSSVAVSKDEKQLILGDKFGDVYVIDINGPVITDLTDPLDADNGKHEGVRLATPILGHVSMLTDVLMATDDKNKEKILTADRDEHIRVSNFPASYVIDKWLFGHKEFISGMVIPEFNRNLLISGGGDEFLALWDWVNGDRPLQTISIKKIIEPYLTDKHLIPLRWIKTEDDKTKKEFAVSNIVVSSVTKKVFVLVEQTSVILVFKFICTEPSADQDKYIEFELLIKEENDRPITSLAIDDVNKTLYYAVDTTNSDTDDIIKLASIMETELANSDVTEKIASNSSAEITDTKETYPLYTIGQLRKRSEH